MVIFYLVNALFFILLVTKCCYMSDEKRHRVCRNIEQLFGISEKPLITNIKQLDEKELEMEQELQNLNNEKDTVDSEISPEEKQQVIEDSQKIVEAIKSDLEKKED